ncbi:hypothetical protein CRM22_009055 [Opisthorchis felineus]|uniref:Uncharacterized protein n=1 Tax=Opisthorchis felineus TaxID=147828 RepID=A0A4S2L967_OPIFE|nr:hypothetical protein CRM22_009055 [Opisthorchis felineus]
MGRMLVAVLFKSGHGLPSTSNKTLGSYCYFLSMIAICSDKLRTRNGVQRANRGLAHNIHSVCAAAHLFHLYPTICYGVLVLPLSLVGFWGIAPLGGHLFFLFFGLLYDFLRSSFTRSATPTVLGVFDPYPNPHCVLLKQILNVARLTVQSFQPLSPFL